jgi:hypothetical protein
VTLDQILAQARAALSAKLAERASLNDSLMALRSGAEAGDVTVTDEKVRAAIEARERQGRRGRRRQRPRGRAGGGEGPRGRPGRPAARVGSTTPAPAYDAVIRTGDVTEARTYTAHAARTEARSFFTDAYNARERDDYQARERLQRHSREVTVHGEVSERALATGGAAGLVVPQYLVDLAAPGAAHRPPDGEHLQPARAARAGHDPDGAPWHHGRGDGRCRRRRTAPCRTPTRCGRT